MSCELRTFARILELDKIKKFLFGDVVETNWLPKCAISYSPAKDILVIAYCNKMVVMESKWNSNDEEVKMTYHIVWQGIPDKCDKELITSVLCLPISTAKKRSRTQTTPDWTCIVVGFTSGYVRFYTEMGSLLLSQQFHDEGVLSITIQSSTLSQYYSKAEKNEDLHILYKTVICSIIGFVVLNTLNACRNHLARVHSNTASNAIAPTLTYRKWAFSSQENIQACAVAGPVPTNMFDHLFTASLVGGFNAKYQNNPPHCHLFAAVGSKPFIGFHYAFENDSQPILSELTKAVATKLKSAIEQSVPNWLLGIRPNPKVPEVRMEPAEEMGCRFGLADEGRQGTSIVMSPLGDIAAVTDNYGRICIVDLNYGIIIRMLKGFRDAHCGWLLVKEDVDKKRQPRRRVQLLVINIPKKGIVEIWTMQFGPKVVSFNVNKDSRVLNANYGIIGLYDGKNAHNTCVLIEPNGEMKEIVIPFYCCLNSRNNDKIRDIHMLKNITRILKDENEQRDKLIQESINLAQNLRTADVIKQAVDSLSSNKYMFSDVLLAFLQSLKDRLSVETDLLERDDHFYINLESLEHLSKLYQFVNNMYQLPPDYSTVVDDSENLIQEACDILHLKEDELDKLMALLPTSRNKQKRVTFSEESASKTREFSMFLSSFDKTSNLKLNPNLSNKVLDKISDLMCSGVMYGKCDLDEWREECEHCKFPQHDLLFLIFRYWLSKPLSLTMVREMLNLYRIVNAVLQIYKADDIKTDWRRIRSQLANSECPLTAITAAIVCRAIASNIQNSQMKNNENETEFTSHADWENVTQEDCDWNLLIGQLEDITFLDSVLKQQPSRLPATLFCVPYEPPNVVLSSILKQGKGSISELVAKWIVSMGLNPELLFLNDVSVLINDKSSPKKSLLGIQEGIALTIDPSVEARPLKSNEKEILDLLEKLVAIFPYSLNANSLLANMTWEYVLTWKKCINDLRPLEAAIATLQMIRCPHIKHGCCFLIWTTHLSLICESAVRLINKVGKLPKDRLCKQEVGIAEENLTAFLNLWVKFIDTFIEAIFDMEVVSKPILKYEPLWEGNAFSPRSTTPPLIELATKQKPANADLLYLLSQCARTLYFLTSFPLRITHPIDSLFPSSSAEMLFTNVQSEEGYYHPNPDEKIIVNRCSYLKKLITNVINEILKPYVEPTTVQVLESADKLKPSVDWISKVFTLAHDWSVPVDPLKRHQICELYTYGYDRLAEEIIPSVNEKEQLGHHLLIILGHRIKAMLDENVSYYSEFTPVVTTWIESLDTRNSVVPVDINDSLQLALTVHSLISESGKDGNLIGHLLDSLDSINSRSSLR
ncbi:rab3 GTPase-activating protein non-catalytic subunit isoform X2 [Planococcus citri]|uniref:rab3 GTPase-activating protein non-catalytic subunit isoform X2 n=1 Tax=Planococcus citri TaxID=170843 RepID=UPI0031F96B98